MDAIQLENREHVSYLRARDASILAGNRRTVLNRLKMNFAEEVSEEDEESCLPTEDEPKLRNIQVFLRIKQVDAMPDLYVLNDNVLRCSVPEGAHGSRNVKDGHSVERTYTFSHIFHPDATQEEVFNHTVKPKLLDLINGKNFTLMTYGASGSGKTFTIVGTTSEPGVVPRALEYLFGSLPKVNDCPSVKPTQTDTITVLDVLARESERNARQALLNRIDKHHVKTYQAMQHRLSSEPVAELIDTYDDISVGVWVSFAEIYNENVYDLLSPEPKAPKPRTKLQLGKSNDKTYVKNLKNINVCSGLEAYQVLQYGLLNLNYASTGINSHSSRSHCIFTVKLVQAVEDHEANAGYYVSYFNFCDLAGSERLKKTLNIGERLKESNNINTSLMVLGRCISLIRDSQQRNENKIIPFRDSKLTMLFQRALSGREDTTMIVNMNPAFEVFEESIRVLNFSAIAKEITVKQTDAKIVKLKKEPTKDRTDNDDEVWRLKELVADLYNEIEQQRSQFEENERTVCEQNYEMFKKFIADHDKLWERRIKRKEEEHESDLAEMKERYESLMEEQRQPKRCKVINLDSSCSSTEDDEERFAKKERNYKERVKELNATVGNLQAELTRCRFERESLLEENARLKGRTEVVGLEMVNLKEQVDVLLGENITLKESIAELTDQLQVYGVKEDNTQEDF